jgi:hypothetical protein
LPGGITPYEAMHGKRPNISNLHAFGCHAEVLIQKRYRRKDLTDSNSESAIFIGYCRQSTGYIFYVPHKHLVVSRRDATFNEAYFPARVGETMLIDRSTIETELADGETNKIDGSSTEPPTGWTIETPERFGRALNPTRTDTSSPSTITNNDKNSDGHDKNINGDETKTASKNMPTPHRLDAEPHDTSPDVKQKAKSRQLLLDHSYIIEASTKVKRAAPHIYDRVRQADGESVTNALKISYKHKDYPNVPGVF